MKKSSVDDGLKIRRLKKAPRTDEGAKRKC